MKNTISRLLSGFMLFALTGLTSAHAAIDAVAAQELMEVNKCGKCHVIDKTKTGPSLKKISAKYKGKADGEEKVIMNITTGPKVKLDDGTEENHKIIKTKDSEKLKNLAQWILSL
jgi:cytochrome c